MKFNSAFFFLLLIFTSLQLTINVEALAAKPEKPERWFEIEVILFKQLNDKSTLKEQFPDNINVTKLPKYRKSFDLLTPYLQPNLAQIKQFAALCGEQDAQHLFLDSLQSVSTPFPNQMQLIEQVAPFSMPDFNSADYIGEEIGEAVSDSENTVPTDNFEANTTQELLAIIEVSSDAEQVEVNAFEFDFQQTELAKPIFSTQNLCVITQSEIDSLFDKEQLADFNLDSFNVDALPSRLNASGAHVRDSPYLMADQSLLLKDVSQRLRWSKEFRPLLHFGWRQVGITKNKAIPLKLFAGKHLEYQYQQAAADYQIEAEETKALENSLFAQLTQDQNTVQRSDQKANNNADLTSIDNELNMKAEYKQQALNKMFLRLENMNTQIDDKTIADTINDIDGQNLDDILAVTNVVAITDDQALDIRIPPKEPLQSWFLDGFFKVHLDRYLYITADFNLFNQNNVKVQIQGDENTETKLINFSQNRRVITGEIHYFDHPYIGMIVQIRRFDPTKPADEAVTQAIR